MMWWRAHNLTTVSAGSAGPPLVPYLLPSTPRLREKVATASTRDQRRCWRHRRHLLHREHRRHRRRATCGVACFTREVTLRHVALVPTSSTGLNPTRLLSMTGCIAKIQNQTTANGEIQFSSCLYK